MIAAAVMLALAVPASAQMANGTGKTGTAMQTESSKPMAEGSMAMSGNAGMTSKTMTMKIEEIQEQDDDGRQAHERTTMMKPDTMKH